MLFSHGEISVHDSHVFNKVCPLPVPAAVTSERRKGALLVDPSSSVATLSGLWEIINSEGPSPLNLKT